jgi:hypothetical protein
MTDNSTILLQKIRFFLKAPKMGSKAADYGLVPMYRTVHRTKPRTLILRAIRFVNPKKFFPKMNLSYEDFQKMDKEELRKTIIDIHEYRREALTIANRYNQMISLIERGKTPYRILWPEKKAMTLSERMDRAKRLQGTTNKWEKDIDKKALVLRRAMLEKDLKMEDVEEIWEPIPTFRDPKKKYTPLRTTKGPLEEPVATEIEDRGEKFRLPAPEEFREGEKQLGHRAHHGHEVPIAMGEYVARGPITPKADTPEGAFPGWDTSIQKAREDREKMDLVPDDNWAFGKKRWNTSEITKVISPPGDAVKKVRKVHFRDKMDDGSVEKGIFVSTPSPQAAKAAHMSYLVDRALGLKVTPRTALKTIGDQQGYMAETISGVDELEMDDTQWNDVVGNQRSRESLYGIALLDIFSGHPDRNGGNLIYSPDHRAFFAAENDKAFGGGEKMEILPAQTLPGMEIRKFPGDADQYRSEIESFFDNKVSSDAVRNIVSEYDLEANNVPRKLENLKGAFVNHMMRIAGQGGF